MPSINVNVITLFIFRFRGTRRHPANLPGRVGLTPRWTKVQNVIPVVQVVSKTALFLNSDAKLRHMYELIVRDYYKTYFYCIIVDCFFNRCSNMPQDRPQIHHLLRHR